MVEQKGRHLRLVRPKGGEGPGASHSRRERNTQLRPDQSRILEIILSSAFHEELNKSVNTTMRAPQARKSGVSFDMTEADGTLAVINRSRDIRIVTDINRTVKSVGTRKLTVVSHHDKPLLHARVETIQDHPSSELFEYVVPPGEFMREIARRSVPGIYVAVQGSNDIVAFLVAPPADNLAADEELVENDISILYANFTGTREQRLHLLEKRFGSAIAVIPTEISGEGNVIIGANSVFRSQLQNMNFPSQKVRD